MTDPGEHDTERGRGTSLKAFRLAGPLFGAGIQMAAAVVLMFFFGRWLDSKFDTEPWLMLLGILFGAGGGMYTFIKTVTEIDKAEKKKDSKEQ